MENSRYLINLGGIIQHEGKYYVELKIPEESVTKEDLIQKFQMSNIDTISYREVVALLKGLIIDYNLDCSDCDEESCKKGVTECYNVWFNKVRNNYCRIHEFTGETKLICDECPFHDYCDSHINTEENCLDVIKNWYFTITKQRGRIE